MTLARGTVIFVVDSDSGALKAVPRNLEAFGFTVHLVNHRAGVVDEVRRLKPDIVLLDLALPDASGLEVLAHIREVSDAQVIVVSALTDERSIFTTLRSGADDYLARPFTIGELQVRIQVALWHAGKRTLEPVLRAGSLRMDFGSHQVTVNGEPIHLTPHEFKLCRLLIEQLDLVVTPQTILSTVWGKDWETHFHLVRLYVSQLRAKLGSDVHIVNLPGVGYRLVAACNPVETAAHIA